MTDAAREPAPREPAPRAAATPRIDVGFSRLSQMVFGYWQAGCLFGLAEAGAFARLATAGSPASQLATELGCDQVALTALLDAGVALGLLTRDDEGRYGNSALAARFLDPASPESLDEWVRTMGQWFGSWSRLGQWLRRPESASDIVGSGTGGADERTFILGMHRYAERTADDVAAVIGLDSSARRLVDVGGGAGTYSLALCRANPGMRAVVLDRPAVLPITRECAALAKLASRVSAEPCDYRSDEFGEGADAVLFSNVMHQESPETVVSMLVRGRRALRDGGTVLIHGHFLDESRTAPVFSTLHNISAMLLWGAGHSYTVADMTGLAETAGLAVERAEQVASAKTTVLACRPVLARGGDPPEPPAVVSRLRPA